jgi:DNA-binding winged helix-turn-helix (wHTH) protein/tetratricopeptide (TPR) repeat protein
MIYTFEEFELDSELYELRRDGKPVRIEPQVFEVMLYLIRHRGRVVSKQELLENVWKTRFVTESALTSRIKAARRAIDDAGSKQRLIGTVHGRGYRFLGRVVERDGSTRPSKRQAPGPDRIGRAGSFVGRQQELQRLRERLAEAVEGTPRTILITGEAGIGKTTTIRTFLDQARNDHDLLVATGHCLEHQGPSEPFMPIFGALDRLCRSNPALDVVGIVARYGPNWLLETPWLVDDDELPGLAQRTIGNTRSRMLRELVETFAAICEVRPLLLVLEDLQWSDPSTLDALNALVRNPNPARLLILCSCRTSELGDPSRPATALLSTLELGGLCEELALRPLTEEEVKEYLLERLPEIALAEGSGRVLHARTEGNPLFLEALVNGIPSEGEPGEQIAWPNEQFVKSVPETLRRMIDQRLADMSRRKQEVLEAAAVVGIEASPVLIARVLDAPEEEIEVLCDQLARVEQFFRRNQLLDASTMPAGFAFAHSIYPEVIYDQMPFARRARLHRAVAQALEASYGSRVAERAGELAFHFGRAHQTLPSAKYLQMAAGQALRRYAYKEALDHLTSALQLLEGLDEPPVELEIALRDMLALTLIMVEGWSYPEIEVLLKKALKLSESLNDPDSQSLLLYHLGAVYENRGEHEKSKEVLERRLRLHPRFTDPTSLLESHELLACALFHKGNFVESIEHADKGWQLYDPERHLALLAATMGENLGVACHSWAALDLWYLGDPAAAKRRMAQALELATDPAHSYSLARAEERAAMLYQLLGEPEDVHQRATAVIELGTRQGHELCVATGHILRGWGRAALGEGKDGLAELQSGLESYQAGGSRIGLPYFLGLLADACLRASVPAAALAATDQALSIIGGRGFSYEAELHRLRGLALVRLGRQDEGLPSLRTAVEVARNQEALSLERRAAATLAEFTSDADEATAAQRSCLR